MVVRCVSIDDWNRFVANHRAEKHTASRVDRTPGKRKAVKPTRAQRRQSPLSLPPHVAPIVVEKTADAPTPQAPQAPAPAASAFERPARQAPRPTAKISQGPHVGGRKALFPLLPSAPTAVGAAALLLAATGAVTIGSGAEEEITATATTAPKLYTHASALTGTSADLSSNTADVRERAVSRDSQREALEDAAAEELQAAAEAQAEERNAALAQLAASAEKQASKIAANAWSLPVSGYTLTAQFGYSSGLWASTHTGLDFAAPSGTPVMAVANATVTSTDWAGAYGNRIVLTHEDGTETWYCHLTSFNVSPGDTVNGGDQIGTVGSTGNSTGSHLHLEVRPGAGDAVDPYAALVAHGLQP